MINVIFLQPRGSLFDVRALKKASRYSGQMNVWIVARKSDAIAREVAQNAPLGSGLMAMVFERAPSENQMLSEVLGVLENAPFVLVRNASNHHTAENLDALIEKLEGGADVALFRCKKNQSKVRVCMENVYKKLCGTFFGFEFFNGDINVMAFSARAHRILKESDSVKLTKIDAWVQMRVEYIEKPLPKPTVRAMGMREWIWPFLWGLGLLTTFAFMIIFGIVGMLNITGFLFGLGAVVMFGALCAYGVLKFVAVRQIGDIKKGKSGNLGGWKLWT